MARPLLWVHAPSVGEGLQARVVLERMRAKRPDVQLAYTFFSPSAEHFAESLDVDFRDYLPFDTAGDAGAALDALRPSALVFSKLDLWPTLCAEASRRGVRLGMISATLATGSSRRGSLAASLLHDAYGLLDAVGAISTDDARRLETLGVRSDRIRVTGDTRFDQVIARAATASRSSPLLAPLAAPRPTLVAGSTWPSDESVLMGSWAAVRAEIPAARLVIAPHEPTPEHLEPLESWARQLPGVVRVARLSAADAATDVVLVDRTGVLGELYLLADAAFVGGGFHTAGLLVRAGGADAVATVDELTEVLVHWLGDAATRQAAGANSRAFVEQGAGAADRSVDMVLSLLDASQLQPRHAP